MFRFELLLFFLLFFISHSNAQKPIWVVSPESSEATVALSFKHKTSLDTTEFSSKQKAKYYQGLASCYHYYNKIDSTKYYIDLSFYHAPNWVCYWMRAQIIQDVPEAEHWRKMDGYYYFASKLDAKYLENFFNRCKACGCYDKQEKKAETPPKKLTTLDTLLLTLQEKDQRIRKEHTLTNAQWEQQHELDRQNRVTLDSIYGIHGFPSLNEVNKESQEVLWFVLQHSTDCEWNKKWFVRFLDAIETGEYRPRFLGQTFERFFHPETGYCKETKGYFIEYLKCKYPQEYAERFGYDDY